jgi:hypothetical protein
MKKPKKSAKSAPKQPNRSKVPGGITLHPHIKAKLQAIAEHEGQAMSAMVTMWINREAERLQIGHHPEEPAIKQTA